MVNSIFKTILIIIIFLVSIEILYPQNVRNYVTIIGIILDNSSNNPVNNAMVLVKIQGKNRILFTKDDGSFQIGNILSGNVKIEIYAVGYITYKESFLLENSKIVRKTFKINRPGEKNLPIVVIDDKFVREVGKQTMSREEIKSIPGARNDPVKAVITTQAGIVSSGGFGSSFVVRGGEPNDNVIYLDNIVALYPFHFGGLISIFHSESIKELDFYTSAFPPGFGPYFGSVMNIKTSRRAKTKFYGNVDINIILASLYLEMPISDNLYIMIGARRSYFDAILPFLPLDIEFDVMPYFYDYFLKVSYDPVKNHEIDLLFFGAYDEMKLKKIPKHGDEEEEDPETQGGISFDNNFYSQGLNWKWDINKDFVSLFTFGMSYNYINASFGTSAQTKMPFYMNLTNYLWQIKERLSLKIDKSLEVFGGVNVLLIRNSYSFSLFNMPQEGESKPMSSIREHGEVFTNDGLFDGNNYNLYIGGIKKIKSWKFLLGLDWNYYNITEDKVLGPKGNVSYDFSKKFSTSFATGIYYQNPQPNELIPPVGTTNLISQRSYHFALSFVYLPTALWEFKLEPYYKLYDLLTVTNPDKETLREQPLLNLGSGRAYGIELNIKKQISDGFYFWINYTLAYAFRRDNDSLPERVSQYDQRHLINIVGSYQPWSHWKFGYKWRLSTGLPSTPIVGRISRDTRTYQPVYGVQLSDRKPIYHELDVRASYIFRILEEKDASFYLEVLNAYMAKNVSRKSYTKNYSNYKNPSSSSGIPLIPAIGFEWTF